MPTTDTTTTMPNTGDTQIANELASHAPQYDLAAARRAGVSDSAIVAELAPHFPSYDVGAARAAFASHAATSTPAAPAATPAPFDRDAYIASRMNNAGLASMGPIGALAAFMSAKPEPVAPGAQPSLLQTVRDHLASGSSYGFGAKAGAAIDAASSSRGMSGYDDELASRRAALESESAAHPKTALASDVAGTIASPLSWLPGVAGAAPVEGSSLLANIARAARGGAVMGTTAALGNNDSSNVGDKISAALHGAVGGAAGGAIGAGVGAVAGKAIGAAAKQFPNAARAIPLIRDLYSSPNDLIPLSSAEQGAMSAGLTSPEAGNALDAAVAAGRGADITAGELTPALSDMANDAQRASPSAYAGRVATVADRQAGHLDRVTSDVSGTFGRNQSFANAQDEYAAARRAFARSPEGYAPVDNLNPNVPTNGDFAHVVKQPGMQDLFDKVKAADRADGGTAPSRIIRVADGSGLGLTSMAPDAVANAQPYSTVKAFQTALEGKAQAAGRAGDHSDRLFYQAQAQSIQDHLENSLPDFELGRVRQTYGRMIGNENALQQGADDFTSRQLAAQDVAPAFNALPPDAQAAYRKGIVSQIRQKMDNLSPGDDATKLFRDASATQRELLKIAAGGEKNLSAFQGRMTAENNLMQMKAATHAPQTAGPVPSFASVSAPVRGDLVPSGMGVGLGALAHGNPAAYVTQTIAKPIRRGLAAQASARGAVAEQSTHTAAGKIANVKGEDALRTLVNDLLTRNAAQQAALARQAVAASARGDLARGGAAIGATLLGGRPGDSR